MRREGEGEPQARRDEVAASPRESDTTSQSAGTFPKVQPAP
jgi:hypothetical protein